METNGAIHEGRAAFNLGSPPEFNPYRKAIECLKPSRHSDDRLAGLRDLECQWDSGYAAQKRYYYQWIKDNEA